MTSRHGATDEKVFGAWWYDYCIKSGLGNTSQRKELARVAWLAARRSERFTESDRNAVLEEAANACTNPIVFVGGPSDTRRRAWTECAAAIRALKNSVPQARSGTDAANSGGHLSKPAESDPMFEPSEAEAFQHARDSAARCAEGPKEASQLMARRYLEIGELGAERVAYDLAHEILRLGEKEQLK